MSFPRPCRPIYTFKMLVVGSGQGHRPFPQDGGPLPTARSIKSHALEDHLVEQASAKCQTEVRIHCHHSLSCPERTVRSLHGREVDRDPGRRPTHVPVGTHHEVALAPRLEAAHLLLVKVELGSCRLLSPDQPELCDHHEQHSDREPGQHHQEQDETQSPRDRPLGWRPMHDRRRLQRIDLPSVLKHREPHLPVSSPPADATYTTCPTVGFHITRLMHPSAHDPNDDRPVPHRCAGHTTDRSIHPAGRTGLFPGQYDGFHRQYSQRAGMVLGARMCRTSLTDIGRQWHTGGPCYCMDDNPSTDDDLGTGL